MTLGIPCHCSEDGAMQIAGNGASEPAPCLRVGGSVSGGEMQSIPSGDTERPVLGRVRLEERVLGHFRHTGGLSCRQVGGLPIFRLHFSQDLRYLCAFVP